MAAGGAVLSIIKKKKYKNSRGTRVYPGCSRRQLAPVADISARQPLDAKSYNANTPVRQSAVPTYIQHTHTHTWKVL